MGMYGGVWDVYGGEYIYISDFRVTYHVMGGWGSG